MRIFLPEHDRGKIHGIIGRLYPAAILAETSLPEAAELADYFRGKRVLFSATLDFSGATVFQRRVWSATSKIPYGEVRSYREIAQAIGKPKAARAVGTALGRNPFPILVPCHRVIREDGGLGGFSASRGIALKQELLQLEGSVCPLEK